MSPRTESHRHTQLQEEIHHAARTSPAEGGMVDTSSVIFPRRKAGQNKRPSTQAPVVVTFEVLQEVFDMPLWKACKTLGICATAMKKVCRKLGVMKWPYKENHMPGKRNKASMAQQSSSSSSGAAGDSSSSSNESDDIDMPSPKGGDYNCAVQDHHTFGRAHTIAGSLKAEREVRSKTKSARSSEALALRESSRLAAERGRAAEQLRAAAASAAAAAAAAQAKEEADREREERNKDSHIEITELSDCTSTPTEEDETEGEEDSPCPSTLVGLSYYEPETCSYVASNVDCSGAYPWAGRCGSAAAAENVRIAMGTEDVAGGVWDDDQDTAWLKSPDLMSGTGFDVAMNSADLDLCF